MDSLLPNCDVTNAVTTVIQRLLQKKSEKSYTLSEVALHCHCNDCWIVVGDHVYDVTTFLDTHPGGVDVMMEHAGRDATVAFYGAGHHPGTRQLLEPFCIGSLAQHERVNLIGTVTSQSSWSRERRKVSAAE